MRNVNVSACPTGCFRPVGLAFDGQGRLFMSSDSTGEIYVITSSDGGSIDSKTLNVTGAAGGTPKKGGGMRVQRGSWVGWVVGFVSLVLWV
jgi:hypothetical protein